MKEMNIYLLKLHDVGISAERRQSIGFDWHRECLKCQECGKVLNPGQHAEVTIDFRILI